MEKCDGLVKFARRQDTLDVHKGKLGAIMISGYDIRVEEKGENTIRRD